VQSGWPAGVAGAWTCNKGVVQWRGGEHDGGAPAACGVDGLQSWAVRGRVTKGLCSGGGGKHDGGAPAARRADGLQTCVASAWLCYGEHCQTCCSSSMPACHCPTHACSAIRLWLLPT